MPPSHTRRAENETNRPGKRAGSGAVAPVLLGSSFTISVFATAVNRKRQLSAENPAAPPAPAGLRPVPRLSSDAAPSLPGAARTDRCQRAPAHDPATQTAADDPACGCTFLPSALCFFHRTVVNRCPLVAARLRAFIYAGTFRGPPAAPWRSPPGRWDCNGPTRRFHWRHCTSPWWRCAWADRKRCANGTAPTDPPR